MPRPLNLGRGLKSIPPQTGGIFLISQRLINLNAVRHTSWPNHTHPFRERPQYEPGT